MNNSYNQFIDTIKKHDDFLIVTHVNPDGDTIGAALAIAHILKQFNKKFTLINESPISSKYLILPLAEFFVTPDVLNNKFGNIIAVDCGDKARIGEQVATKIANDINVFINIDHHHTNDNFGTLNIVDAHAASTTMVIYNILKDTKTHIDYQSALCLYTGLMTDTGSFKYSNTSVEAHLMAADLISYGIDAFDVVDKIVESNTLNQIQTIRDSLRTLEINATGQIASIIIATVPENKANDDGVDGLINYPRSIEGVEVAVSFKQIDDEKIKVGLRSKKYVDVSAIAQKFGGGGHKRAAGCTVIDTLEDAKDKLLTEISKHL